MSWDQSLTQLRVRGVSAGTRCHPAALRSAPGLLCSQEGPWLRGAMQGSPCAAPWSRSPRLGLGPGTDVAALPARS